jgi:hypothetical protein
MPDREWPRIDPEKPDVCRPLLDFLRWSETLKAEIGNSGGEVSDIVDHWTRASLSALLNTAEGNGKRPRSTRGKLFDDA